jgi:hypothetical protein
MRAIAIRALLGFVLGGAWGLPAATAAQEPPPPAAVPAAPATAAPADEAPPAPEPATPAPSGAPPPAAAAASADEEVPAGAWATLRRDYGAFYSRRGLLQLGGGLAVAGVLANTDADQELFDSFHGRDSSDPVVIAPAADEDSFANGVSDFGYAALGGAVIGAALIGIAPDGDPKEQRPVGRWVRRSARAYAVGLPAMYYLQQLVGSGRPGEPEGSGWQIFGESHGVSGHAFLGAVPFLTIVRQSDNRGVQAAALVASLAPAWARVEEEKHYPSQALLGWYLAWIATGAVDRSDFAATGRTWAVLPGPAGRDGAGIYVHATF